MRHKEAFFVKLMKGAVSGALGGLAGAWTMSQFAGAFDRLVLKEKPRPFLVKGSKLAMNASPQEWDSTVTVADDVSRKVFNRALTREQRALAATAVHYAMGMAMGVGYGMAAEIAPVTKSANGVAFGVGVWLIAFEYLMPKYGITRKRDEYTKAMRADSAGEHIVFGMTAELIRGAVRGQLE